MKLLLSLLGIALAFVLSSPADGPVMKIAKEYTVDSLGACQGISYQQGKVFLYGDREVGIIREFRQQADSLQYTGREMKLTLNDTDVINHPTGIAYNGKDPVFIGNSIRLNKEGSLWRAVIYHINWQGLQKTGTLDGNLLHVIEDDTCVQGTRPEYVQYNKKWYVATADYGPVRNEVRLYDPALLAKAKKTSDKNVLYKKFTCTPWVQNLHWIASKGQLLLIQNQVEGRKWRFTYLDLAKSIASGQEQVIKVIDLNRTDELEGFSFLASDTSGFAVSSSRTNNVNAMHIAW
ncbi:MAG TPA: hypothetical protein VL307_11125 [Chitinophagaceae bacterium]|nr:hypothetical protein [Chitinophagaceae bacterium]